MQPGVVGVLLVSHNGHILEKHLPDGIDHELIAVISAGMYLNTSDIGRKWGRRQIDQMVCKTDIGYFVVGNAGSCILVMLVEPFTLQQFPFTTLESLELRL
jgi:predicted regulator of Ras-like GTPase activity (Roadblock/LC7/MglB family)